MKGWAISCLVSSVIAGMCNILIPDKKGELTKTVKFISGIILIAVCFSPIIKLFGVNFSDISFESYYSEKELQNGIYEKCMQNMENKLRVLYPDDDFTIQEVVSESGELKKVCIFSKSENAEKIAKTLKRLYDIDAEVK